MDTACCRGASSCPPDGLIRAGKAGQNGGMRHPLTLLAALLFPLAVVAAPTDPLVLERPDDALGDPHVVGLRTLADVPQAYVEEELFVAGDATVYTY